MFVPIILLSNYSRVFDGSNTYLKGPVEGQWGQWGAWKACSINTKMEYGTGTKIRYRECNNPAPACGGHTCVGDNFYIGNCRSEHLTMIQF